MTTNRWCLAWVVWVAVGAGCNDDFVAEYRLVNARVLAIESSLLEVGPGEELTLRPKNYLPPGISIESETWKVCPVSLGSSTGYQCIDPKCETTVVPSNDGSLTLFPSEAALACFASLASAAGEGTEAPTALEDIASVPMTFTYRLRTSDGDQRIAVKSLDLWLTEQPPERNSSPKLSALKIGDREFSQSQGSMPGVIDGNYALEVSVDEASIDSYSNADGQIVKEEILITLFSTAGQIDDQRSTGPVAVSNWATLQLSPDDRQYQLYVVLRDLRGGQSAVGPYTIEIP